MNLRRPWDTLAGCAWLPRLADKLRLRASGTLPAEYASVVLHPRATDGVFVAHFGLDPAALETAALAGDDALAAWFLAQPGVDADTRAAWNALAPQLGRPGTPMERSFRVARRIYFRGREAEADTLGIDTVFAAIALDEGYLADLPSAPPPGAS